MSKMWPRAIYRVEQACVDVGSQISEVLGAIASGKQGASREFWLARRQAAGGKWLADADRPDRRGVGGLPMANGLAWASIAESSITHYRPRAARWRARSSMAQSQPR